MAKRGPKKKTDTEKLLIENFAGLQQALTNLSLKFTELSENFSKLLKVFEEAAKNMAKEQYPEDDELAEKLEELFEQNKTIAKSLILIQEKLDEKKPQEPPRTPAPTFNTPTPTFPSAKQPPKPLPNI